MASNTGKTRLQRKKKRTAQGKRRKREERNAGTTPKFPVHKD